MRAVSLEISFESEQQYLSSAFYMISIRIETILRYKKDTLKVRNLLFYFF